MKRSSESKDLKLALVKSIPLDERIITIRDQKVILDADLAEVYGVTTKRLNEQVKRNQDRFPPDFSFQLTATEKTEVVANCDHLAKLPHQKRTGHYPRYHGAQKLMTAAASLAAKNRIQL